MEIFIKQYTGRSVALEVSPDEPINSVAKKAFEKRENMEVSVESYFQALSFIFAGRFLELDRTLADYNVTQHATVHEVAKSWTMAFGVDYNSLSATCPITLEKIKEPFPLSSSCYHIFEKGALLDALKSGNTMKPQCPVCRTDISLSDIKRLVAD